MKVSQLILKGFRGFENSTINFDPQLTVLVGVNGSGKTSALDATFFLLSQYIARLVASPSSAQRLNEEDVRIGTTETSLKITTQIADGNQISWSLVKQRASRRIVHPNSSDFDTLNDYVRRIASGYGNGRDYLSGETIAVYYDQRRAILDIPQRKRTKIEHDAEYAFKNSLRPGAIDFRRLTYWFEEREGEELRRQRRDRDYVDRQLEAVRLAITSATGLRNPYYSIEKPRGLRVEKDGLELHVSQLSAGERTFFALAGDLARRLAMANLDSETPLRAPGIVLVDEVELHLHPGWQRKIIAWLLETFPNCQFIVSTHSPQVLGEVHAHQIRILEARGNTIELAVPAASYGRDSNYLLLSVLGAEERRSRSKELLEKIDDALGRGRLEEARERIRALDTELEGSPPELAIAEARLARRERRQST
ncbi:MAG TPA: AAA family ATPase [Beijerinckiaceae bacterium]|jgi:predicted ATP-binding protein involved in virulence